MNASKHGLGSDLAKVDDYRLTETDYADSPELDDGWFDSAMAHVNSVPVKRGRPKIDDPKVQVNIRLSSEVVKRFKASGRGWQTRIDAALEEWLNNHPEIGGA